MDIASEADFHLLTDEELREFIASLDVPRARVQSFLAPKLDPQVVHAATRELLIEQLPRLIPKLADTRDAAQTDDEDEDVAQEAGETVSPCHGQSQLAAACDFQHIHIHTHNHIHSLPCAHTHATAARRA